MQILKLHALNIISFRVFLAQVRILNIPTTFIFDILDVYLRALFFYTWNGSRQRTSSA
jgi:hypothetical protein